MGSHRRLCSPAAQGSEAWPMHRPVRSCDTSIPAQAAGGQDGESGPTSADIAAAQAMDPAQRKAMVEQMVQRLAIRLEEGRGSITDWLRLVRAYTVLERRDDAVKALDRAKTEFSGNSQALEELDRLATELGLKS